MGILNKLGFISDRLVIKILSIVFLFQLISFHSFSQVSYCDTANVDMGLFESYINCDADSIVISSNTLFNSYSWSNGDTLPQTTFYYSGLYYLSVTDDSSCIHVDSVLVSLINGNIVQNDTVLCFGESLLLSTNQFSENKKSTHFQGSSYTTFIDTDFPDGSQDRTVEFWIKNEGQMSLNYIFSYGDIINDNGFSVLIDQNDSLYLKIGNSTYSCSQIIPQNVWSHIAISTDPSLKYTFSIDGVFINTNIISGNYNTILIGSGILGKNPNSSTGYFNGKLDELRIWDRFISTGEFDNQFHLNSYYDSDLLRYWDFNYNYTSSFYDMLGNEMALTNVMVTSDIPFVSYKFITLWNGVSNSDTYTFTANQTEINYLSLSDGISNCLDSIIVTVVQPPGMIDSIAFCNLDTINLDAGFGYSTYLWNNGSGLQFIEATSSGTYIVEVTSGSCTYTDSTYVSLVSINIDQSDFNACYGDSIILEAFSNMGNYYWSTDQITSSISFLAENNVSLQVSTTDGYSSCYDNINITVIPEIILGLEDTIMGCNINSVNLFIPGQFFPYYQWSNGDTSQISTVGSSGLYYVTVNDANNCIAFDSVFVSILDINIIQSDTVLCSPNPITLSTVASSSGIVWSNGATSSSIIVTPSISTQYFATIYEGSYSCSDAVLINVSDPINISLPDSLLSCEGGILTLDASGSGGNSYLWSSGETTSIISVSTSNIYYITVSGDYSCQEVDSTVVSIIDAFITITDTLVCEGEEVIISTNSSIYDYSWSNGSSDAIIFVYPEVSTNYHVYISDGFASCHLLTSVAVINVVTGSIFGSQSVYSDSIEIYSINETPGSVYQWFVSGGFYANNIGSEIEVTWGSGSIGYVSVTETSSEGCIGDPVGINIVIQFPDGIEITHSNPIVKLFPNPTSENLNVVVSKDLINNILIIYDSQGRIIYRTKLYDENTLVPVTNLTPGVYTLQLNGYSTGFIVK